MKLAVSLATLLLSSGASAFGSVVPTQFVGHWAGSPDACDSDADDLVLRVGASHISYWESEGPIRAVVSRGQNEFALIAELTGEGETWLATARFTLSADGQRLVDSTSVPGQETVRCRCPVAGDTRPN